MLVGVCAEYQEWNILRFLAENAIQENLMSNNSSDKDENEIFKRCLYFSQIILVMHEENFLIKICCSFLSIKEKSFSLKLKFL